MTVVNIDEGASHFLEPGELDGFGRAVLGEVIVKISFRQSHLNANTG